jgi:hypothetical protein
MIIAPRPPNVACAIMTFCMSVYGSLLAPEVDPPTTRVSRGRSRLAEVAGQTKTPVSNMHGSSVKRAMGSPVGFPVLWTAVVPAVTVAVPSRPRVDVVDPCTASTFVRSSVVEPESLCLTMFAAGEEEPGFVVLCVKAARHSAKGEGIGISRRLGRTRACFLKCRLHSHGQHRQSSRESEIGLTYAQMIGTTAAGVLSWKETVMEVDAREV